MTSNEIILNDKKRPSEQASIFILNQGSNILEELADELASYTNSSNGL